MMVLNMYLPSNMVVLGIHNSCFRGGGGGNNQKHPPIKKQRPGGQFIHLHFGSSLERNKQLEQTWTESTFEGSQTNKIWC